jgi:hypothetical protein
MFRPFFGIVVEYLLEVQGMRRSGRLSALDLNFQTKIIEFHLGHYIDLK